MSEISPTGNPHAAVNRVSMNRTNLVSIDLHSIASSDDSDTLEVSERARLFAMMDQMPDIRQDLVDRVKPEVLADVYDDEVKFSAAVDKLLEEEF